MRDYCRRSLGGICILLALVASSSAQTEEALSAQDAVLIAVARAGVQNAVAGKAYPAIEEPYTHLTAQGVFVTIERNGVVVGCRGTLQPHCADLTTEVREAARSAATMDPPYRPLTPADLSRFLVTVTIVDRLETIDRAGAQTLLPEQGLVLEANGKTGIVLPWEGRDPATRLRWAYRKAGVPEGTSCLLKRLIARRFRG